MDTLAEAVLWIIYIIFLFLNVFWLLVYFLDTESWKPRKRLKEYPFVTIAIPARNEEEVIELTLKSAINIDYPRDKYEIILILNDSKDDTLKIAKEVKRKNKETLIKILDIKEKGKGLALNKALKIANGEFFVLLDADSYVEKGALKELLTYFGNDRKIACVLPMMKVGKPETFLQKLQWHEYILNIFFKKIMGTINCVHVAPGPFSVYRTLVLRRLGGFDHPNLTEDLEITLKLQKHHYKIIQTTDVGVKTIAPGGIKELYKQRNRWYKGSIHNSLSKQYRGMWFNKDYGDFGFIQMPIIIIPGFLAVILLIIQGYYFIKAAYSLLFKIYSVNFDLPTLIVNLSFDFNILDGNYTKLVIALLMFCLGMLTFILSHRITKEKLFKYGKLPALVFLFLFPFFLAFVWISILLELLISKKAQDW